MTLSIPTRVGILLILLASFAVSPVHADGIAIDAVIAVGLGFGIPIVLFIVLVEGMVAWRILKMPFGLASRITFFANVVSTLAGIPLMIVERVIFYSLVPKELHLYFKAYLIASIFIYFLFLIVTILVECAIWRRRLQKEVFVFVSKDLVAAMVVGNILSYAVLCPLHYSFTRPIADVDQLTADTSWAKEPTTTVYYIDSATKYLNRIQTNGGGRETIVPFPMKDYVLSEDLETCVFQGTDGNLYHRNDTHGMGKLLSDRFLHTSDEFALSGNGQMVAFIESKDASNSLKIVSIEGLEGIKTEFEKNLETYSMSVAWLKDSTTAVYGDRNGTSGYMKEEGSWKRFFTPSEIVVTASYSPYHEKYYMDRSFVENLEFWVGAYHTYSEGLLYIKQGDANHMVISDNPGYIGLPRRGFSSPAFLENGKELLVEDGHSIYLIDLEGRRIGHLVNGNNFVIQSEQFTKQHLFESDP